MPLSNHYKYQVMKGEIAFLTDTFKIVLMDNTFTFDIDAHATLADVAADLLTEANGYTAATLANVALTEDDTNDRGEASWDDQVWTASGGSIGAANGAIIYDDTTSDDTIVGYLDFGASQIATDGGTFTISNIKVRTT